jgi:hypothetical protein
VISKSATAKEVEEEEAEEECEEVDSEETSSNLRLCLKKEREGRESKRK